MDKLEDISVLLFAGGDDCPDALAPAHTGLATSDLRYPAINYSMANRTLGGVVGRLYVSVCQKTEIICRCIAFEPLGQLFR